MGLASQMILWDEELCGMFVERGFHVIRFDNRDVGHSSHVRGGGKPRVLRAMAGITRNPHYTLDDLADDAFGLLDQLDIDAAHVAGASMGGMIAQTMAIRRPERVLSLASIMSTTGNRRVGMPRLRALGLLLRKAPRDRDSYVEYVAGIFKVIRVRPAVDFNRLEEVLVVTTPPQANAAGAPDAAPALGWHAGGGVS